nr:MAG TPA: hypothetical protein [Caudoviricetes sp.]
MSTEQKLTQFYNFRDKKRTLRKYPKVLNSL